MRDNGFLEASNSDKAADDGSGQFGGISSQKETSVSPDANIAGDVKLGRGVIVGPDVTIAGGCVLQDDVEIRGITYIGRDNFISRGALLGMPPQDLDYSGENTGLILGENNFIGPRVTIHRGSSSGKKTGDKDTGNSHMDSNFVDIPGVWEDAANRLEGLTAVGKRNTFKAFVHIAHDCLLGCDNTLEEYVQLSGHVKIESGCMIGSLSGIHQFVRMGRLARVVAHTKVTKDIPPYFKVGGHPAELLEPVSEEILKNYEVRKSCEQREAKREFQPPEKEESAEKEETFDQIVRACSLLSSEGLNTSQAVEKMETEMSGRKIEELIEFIRNSSRGICG